MNPHKGEVEFDADGKTYTLSYSTNAVCEAEAALNRTIVDIGQDMASGKISMTAVRALLWAGLQDHHPGLALRAAGDLILAAGGLARVIELIGEAFALAFPAAETKGAHPPKETSRPKNGIGRVS